MGLAFATQGLWAQVAGFAAADSVNHLAPAGDAKQRQQAAIDRGRGSDQSSFIAQGVPAVRFIESHECSSSPVDNSCPAALNPADPSSALTNGRPCPSPYAVLPRTDARHNCLHTNFVARGTLDGVDVSTKICKSDDERAHGVGINASTPAPESRSQSMERLATSSVMPRTLLSKAQQ